MSKNGFSRRDVLRLGLNAGLALSPLGLYGCGGAGSSSASAGTGNGGGNPPPSAGYKALVCISLRGGNDAYNTLVPMTASRYAQYSAVRGALALERSSLLPLAGNAADGAAYGLHPSLAALHRMFNSGDAAIVTNVGSLVAPTTRDDFLQLRNLPSHLFSHNDQRDQWATSIAQGGGASGWAGRLADLMPNANPGALLPLNLSIAGADLFQSSETSSALTLVPQGPLHLGGLGTGSPLRTAFDALHAQSQPHVLGRAYADGMRRGLAMHAQIDSVLDAMPALATSFPTSNEISGQLRMVARLIAARSQLGMQRQIFFVEYGNFDTHDAQLPRHALLLQKLSEAIDAFQQAMAEVGATNDVTTFTTSDFGRTFTMNGDGTDHGWSGHHFVVGGAVRGGQFYGTMPSLEPEGADDSRGGRFIPTTSVDEYAATFARWFGVADSDLGRVLPNLSRFATRGLSLLG